MSNNDTKKQSLLVKLMDEGAESRKEKFSDPLDKKDNTIPTLCAPFPGMNEPWSDEKKKELETVLKKYEPENVEITGGLSTPIETLNLDFVDPLAIEEKQQGLPTHGEIWIDSIGGAVIALFPKYDTKVEKIDWATENNIPGKIIEYSEVFKLFIPVVGAISIRVYSEEEQTQKEKDVIQQPVNQENMIYHANGYPGIQIIFTTFPDLGKKITDEEIYTKVFGDKALDSEEEIKDNFELIALARSLTGAESDTLKAAFFSGPLSDGDVPSKSGRNTLLAKGLIAKIVMKGRDGFNACTHKGAWVYRAKLCIFDDSKLLELSEEKSGLIDKVIKGETTLVSMKNICDRLSISRSTLERRIKEKKFPAPDFKIGGRHRWCLETISGYFNTIKTVK